MSLQMAAVTFGSLERLDPKLEILLQKHLSIIANDCMNRPGDQTTRKLLLEFHFDPVMDLETRECDRVNLTISARSKVPDYKTKSFPLDVGKAGFRFNADIPDSLDQSPIPFKD